VDEAHRLKSGAQGLLFQALHNLDTNHRLLLTGTPLQNTLEELFSLLFFLEPAKFHDMDSLRAAYNDDHQKTSVNGYTEASTVASLRSLLEGHMLRRLKSDVKLSIPEKHELIVRVELKRELRFRPICL
jgi:SNF2 family DNA or RNA helicase